MDRDDKIRRIDTSQRGNDQDDGTDSLSQKRIASVVEIDRVIALADRVISEALEGKILRLLYLLQFR